MARRIRKAQAHAVALKAEKMQKDESSDDDSEESDEELALITKALARFGKSKYFKKGSGSRNTSSRERSDDRESTRAREERTCFRCQTKGHVVKDCRRKKNGEPAAERPPMAMMATWGNTDGESDDGEARKEICLMAYSTSSEVDETDSFINDVFVHSDLAETIASVLYKNKRLKERIAELEEEQQGDLENNQLWAEKAMCLEKEAVEHVCICSPCKKGEDINKVTEGLRRVTIKDSVVEVLQMEVSRLKDELETVGKRNQALQLKLEEVNRGCGNTGIGYGGLPVTNIERGECSNETMGNLVENLKEDGDSVARKSPIALKNVVQDGKGCKADRLKGNQRDIQCYSCGKYGHFSYTCYSR